MVLLLLSWNKSQAQETWILGRAISGRLKARTYGCVGWMQISVGSDRSGWHSERALASTDERTALAEMRPWVTESLTLVIFKIKKQIKIVDCQAGAENWGERAFGENPSAERLDKYIWNDISEAFSRPINREEQESAYLPTQILAEAFKAEGFDGLAYRSGLERGTNVVLFNVRVAKLTERFVYTLKKVRYDFEAVPSYGIYRQKCGEGKYITEIHTESR
jgi:hypothetical protein